MPLLSLGTIIYGLAGFLYTQDILWLINFNPYIKYASDIYGQGSFYHYITHLPDVVGIVLYFLLLLGILHMIFSLLSSKTKISSDKLVLEIFLVYSIFFSFLIFYSFIWWKGLFLSGGQMRIMVSMVPLISLICLNGYNHLVKIFKNTIIRKSFHFIVLLFVILIPFIKYDFPIQLDPEQKLMKEVGEWYISSDYRGYMLYYFYPFLSYTANIDHFDSSKVRPLNTILYKEVSKDSIIIWDSFFGPTVSDVPLDFIKNNEDYILVKTFISEKERDIEEPEFEVYIFQKV
ncbi:MAG: hypothetical protein ISS23_00990 [Nanoarchaeota archaeon]|nr:hypothetical protein [Nanoarchaeota archaeon]